MITGNVCLGEGVCVLVLGLGLGWGVSVGGAPSGTVFGGYNTFQRSLFI